MTTIAFDAPVPFDSPLYAFDGYLFDQPVVAQLLTITVSFFLPIVVVDTGEEQPDPRPMRFILPPDDNALVFAAPNALRL